MNIKDFSESIENTLEKCRIDSAEGILKKVCLMRSESRNGRVYSKDAMEDIFKLLQTKQIKAFLNHPERPTGHSVGNLLGYFRSPTLDSMGEAIFSDLVLLNESPYKNLLMGIARDMPDTVGFSINGRGRFGNTLPDGREEVVGVEHLTSVDCVSFPATTNGLFESMYGEDLKVARLKASLLDSIKHPYRHLLRIPGLKDDGY